MDFTNKLKLLRLRKGLSQSQLANELHVAQSSVHYWENGEKKPSVDVLTRISKLFNVPIDTLINDDIALKPNTELYTNPLPLPPKSNSRPLSNTNKTRSPQIQNISDIMQMLFLIEEKINIEINCDKSIVDVNDSSISFKKEADSAYVSISISFHNPDVNDILMQWMKMKALHDNELIDDNVYSLWKKNELTKAENKKI